MQVRQPLCKVILCKYIDEWIKVPHTFKGMRDI
jgi:hypothetical protein